MKIAEVIQRHSERIKNSLPPNKTIEKTTKILFTQIFYQKRIYYVSIEKALELYKNVNQSIENNTETSLNSVPCSHILLNKEGKRDLENLQEINLNGLLYTKDPDVTFSQGFFSKRINKITHQVYIEGQIDQEILKKIPNLENLTIKYNKLSGTIPKNIRDLEKLQKLDLSHNNLSGNLPQLPKKINQINLSGNNFYGTIPKQWADLENLKKVILPRKIYDSQQNESMISQLEKNNCIIQKEPIQIVSKIKRSFYMFFQR